MLMNNLPLAFAVNRLARIDKVERRLDSEAGLFGEIREILKRHGVEKKYGLVLLHKHFDLADDEILMEYTGHGEPHSDHEADASPRHLGRQCHRKRCGRSKPAT